MFSRTGLALLLHVLSIPFLQARQVVLRAGGAAGCCCCCCYYPLSREHGCRCCAPRFLSCRRARWRGGGQYALRRTLQDDAHEACSGRWGARAKGAWKTGSRCAVATGVGPPGRTGVARSLRALPKTMRFSTPHQRGRATCRQTLSSARRSHAGGQRDCSSRARGSDGQPARTAPVANHARIFSRRTHNLPSMVRTWHPTQRE